MYDFYICRFEYIKNKNRLFYFHLLRFRGGGRNTYIYDKINLNNRAENVHEHKL